MAASRSSAAHSLPLATYSSLTSNSLEPQSSLNSALRIASSATESRRTEHEEEGTSDLQQVEEGDLIPYLHENGRKRGGEESRTLNGSQRPHIPEGIEGLSSQLSTVGSVRMEDLSEEDEMASTSDSESFEACELELIEAALRSLRSVEGDLRSVEGEIEGSSGSTDLQDMQDVARLLKKVQAVKARMREAPLMDLTPSLGGSFRQRPSGGEDLELADIRQVVQAAAQTALAAAKTAETVVSSLNRNSQAMEELCKALTGSSSLQPEMEETVKEAETEVEEEGKMLAIELQQTEIAKSLVRQNKVTHWVLGFIVLSSFVWRYGVVKFVRKVNDTVTNPLQGLTDMFGGKKDNNEKDKNIPQFKLPTIMDNEEDRKHHAAEEKEDNVFSFGSIFSGSNDAEEAEQQKQKAAKEDRKFNLWSILPGLGEQKEEEQCKAKKREQKAKKEKEDERFNLDSIFSGLTGEEEEKKHKEQHRKLLIEQRKLHAKKGERR